MKVKILLFVVALAAVAVVVVQTSRISGLRERAVAAEHKRLDLLMEMLCPGKGVAMEVVGVDQKSAYQRAANAYQDCDLLALRTALSLCNNCPIEIERILLSPFNNVFLRTQTLREFAHVEEFERFAWANVEVSMFLGRSCFRCKDFETPICIEYLTFLRFKNYRDKFEVERKNDLAQMAQHFMDLWAAHIESPEGFTRIGLRGLVRQRTELDEAVRPGSGVSQNAVIEFCRGMSMGLVRCGYMPKWLDEEFPPLSEGATKAGNLPK